MHFMSLATRSRPPTGSASLPCTSRATADNLRKSGYCRIGWSNVLWAKATRPVPACRGLCR
jgi:hypothetical protein